LVVGCTMLGIVAVGDRLFPVVCWEMRGVRVGGKDNWVMGVG